MRKLTDDEIKDLNGLSKEFNRDVTELEKLLIDNGLETIELFRALQLFEL